MEKAKFEDFKTGQKFHVSKSIIVYTHDVEKGSIQGIIDDLAFKTQLIYKGAVMELLPHPHNPMKRILRFFSDDLIPESNKIHVPKRNMHLNCLDVDADAYIPSGYLVPMKKAIAESIKQYEHLVTIPTTDYNIEDLFNDIGNIYRVRSV